MMFDVTWLNCRIQLLVTFEQEVLFHTIARGNCKSMNNAIAGNMTSEVRGRDEVRAAVAKELNATSRGIPLHKVVLKACEIVSEQGQEEQT
jgi:hypothetical protein